MKIMVLTLDSVGPAMAGPAIRALEIARHVHAALGGEVTLAAPRVPLIDPGDAITPIGYHADPRGFTRVAREADAIILQGTALEAFPWLARARGRLIVDLYDPFHLENLELYRHAPAGPAQNRLEWDLRILVNQLRVGDFFLCATDRQRDYWLGMLSGAGRLGAADYRDDPTLRRLIDVVPYGLPDRPPRHTRQVLKGVLAGVGADTRVLLWGGGVWDWLDPLTAIRAAARLYARAPETRLVFMGSHRPGDATAGRRPVDAARALARDLGVLDRAVIFNDWVEYADRENFLLEADVGITLARGHLENRYAYRARMLDYLWAGLPIVCSGGDVLADHVAAHGPGAVVDSGDVDGCVQACARLLFDRSARDQPRADLADMQWTATLRPLIHYLQAPPPPRARRLSTAGQQPLQLARLAWLAFRTGGLREVVEGASRFLGRHWTWPTGVARGG
jgi:glycosyltransferase involved in cell wall biosynthesis